MMVGAGFKPAPTSFCGCNELVFRVNGEEKMGLIESLKAAFRVQRITALSNVEP
jgi:hypothetical protein